MTGAQQSWTDNLAVIMVRPEFLGNLGATCRVMKNFNYCIFSAFYSSEIFTDPFMIM